MFSKTWMCNWDHKILKKVLKERLKTYPIDLPITGRPLLATRYECRVMALQHWLQSVSSANIHLNTGLDNLKQDVTFNLLLLQATLQPTFNSCHPFRTPHAVSDLTNDAIQYKFICIAHLKPRVYQSASQQHHKQIRLFSLMLGNLQLLSTVILSTYVHGGRIQSNKTSCRFWLKASPLSLLWTSYQTKMWIAPKKKNFTETLWTHINSHLHQSKSTTVLPVRASRRQPHNSEKCEMTAGSESREEAPRSEQVEHHKFTFILRLGVCSFY